MEPGGFNPDLGPQRAVNYEIGARGQPVPTVSYSVALFLGRITDAIVQGREVGGTGLLPQRRQDPQRRRRGRPHRLAAHGPHLERSLHLRRTLPLCLGDTSRRQPAARRARAFLALRAPDRLPGDSSSMPTTRISTVASPRTTRTRLIVDAWGAGVTNLRLGWDGQVGSMEFGPFLGVNNLLDRRYVGSVTLNGVGGRVFEPAPAAGHSISGAEIGYRRRRLVLPHR